MRITLVGKEYILKQKLPKNIINGYWITDKDKQLNNILINIRLNNGKYEIVSSKYSKIIDIIFSSEDK